MGQPLSFPSTLADTNHLLSRYMLIIKMLERMRDGAGLIQLRQAVILEAEVTLHGLR